MPKGVPKNGIGGQFKKGDDPKRNANGQRNATAVAFSKTLRELIVAEGEQRLTGADGKEYSKVEVFVKTIWQDALKGDNWCRNFIAERTEGKITQPIGGDNERPFKIVVEYADTSA